MLPEDAFHLSRTLAHRGRQTRCKACKSEWDRQRRQHPARLQQQACKRWREANRERVLSHNAARRSRQERAGGSGQGKAGVALRYRLAGAARALGADVVVDHWLPLKGAEVCGMHVPANLVLVHRLDNAAKWRKVPDFEPPPISVPICCTVNIRGIFRQQLRSGPL